MIDFIEVAYVGRLAVSFLFFFSFYILLTSSFWQLSHTYVYGNLISHSRQGGLMNCDWQSVGYLEPLLYIIG